MKSTEAPVLSGYSLQYLTATPRSNVSQGHSGEHPHSQMEMGTGQILLTTGGLDDRYTAIPDTRGIQKKQRKTKVEMRGQVDKFD